MKNEILEAYSKLSFGNHTLNWLRLIVNKMGKKMASEYAIYEVTERLFHLGIISRKCFVSFKQDFVELAQKFKKYKDPEDTSLLWEFVRGLFDFDDDVDCIPINAANLCPSFHPVQKLVNHFEVDMNRDVSIQKRVSVFAETIDKARDVIALQLNVAVDELAFMRNATEANNIINNGLDFNDGDEVVIWKENHGTNNRAWTIRQQRFKNFKIVVVDTAGAHTEDELVKKFMDEVNEKTRVVTFSEISNESGWRLPAKRLCSAIHKFNSKIHVHVDGAQSWGALKLDLKDMGCDSFAASAHKWFLGPKESGLFYMKKDLVTNFWPNNFGYDAKIVLPTELYDNAHRFETLGQRNDPTLIGLLYTASVMWLIGFKRIEERIQFLVNKLYCGLEEMGYTMTTPADPALRHGVVVIKFEDPEEGKRLYEYLYTEHRIGVSSTGGLRICPHIYNTEEHIDRVLKAIQEFKQPKSEVEGVAKKRGPRKC